MAKYEVAVLEKEAGLHRHLADRLSCMDLPISLPSLRFLCMDLRIDLPATTRSEYEPVPGAYSQDFRHPPVVKVSVLA